ncbi:MAG: hypothetical protein M3163_03100 [Actinomycetota bacterium]|nr:hypothetical protein [Actinomycetota bacterium]
MTWATPPRWPTPPWSTRSGSGPRRARTRSSGLADDDGLPEGARHWRWRAHPRPRGPAVVVDIDGVLSNADTRQHFLEDKGRRNWRAFFDACGEDTLIDEVGRLVELLDPGLVVVLLTGRPLRVQSLTMDWLERYGVRWDLLIMRTSGDYSASREFKRATVKELRAHGFDLRLALEDDPRNREMFHEEGLPCIYIHSGYYEQY